jgi:hypothetical protein
MLYMVFVALLLSHVDAVLKLHSQDMNVGIDEPEFRRSISQLSELTRSLHCKYPDSGLQEIGDAFGSHVTGTYSLKEVI